MQAFPSQSQEFPYSNRIVFDGRCWYCGRRKEAGRIAGTMNADLLWTLGILIVAMVLFLSEKLSVDLVALLVVLALGTTGVLTPQEVFSGFSRHAVIILMAIFILTEGLARTGVTSHIGDLLLRIAGNDERRLVMAVMIAGSTLSLFMNNIAAVSILLPAVSGAARKAGVSQSRVLMPLAFATLLGGMATLLTTTNIVVSGLVREAGFAGFGLFDFFPIAFPLVLAGILYMIFVGRRLLPSRSSADREPSASSQSPDLVDLYEMGGYLFRAAVPTQSRLVGQSLRDSAFRDAYGLTVVGLEHDGRLTLSPPPDTTLQQGDVLLLAGEAEELLLRDAAESLEILPPGEGPKRDLESAKVTVVEAVLSPRSRLIGQTLSSVHFYEKYHMNVLALLRAGRKIYVGLADLPLQFGDALLMHGSRDRVPVLQDDPDLIVVSEMKERAVPIAGKGKLAIAIMIATLAVAASGYFSVAEVMLAGALTMVLVGAVTMDEAYHAIEWRVVFLVAGMLPLGAAMIKTGLAQLMATGLAHVLGHAGPVAMLAGLLVMAIAFSQVMKGAAIATVMTPIAIQAAHAVGAEPRAFAMGVALATSMAFVTPLGHPVNILVMGEARYGFRDYMKVGLPLTVLLFAAVLVLLPIFWPLTPK
jgi:di/tricarboxylate transporter